MRKCFLDLVAKNNYFLKQWKRMTATALRQKKPLYMLLQILKLLTVNLLNMHFIVIDLKKGQNIMICPFEIKLRLACIKDTVLTLTQKNDITITEKIVEIQNKVREELISNILKG